uniref:Uncharacterized protein n=1 Tax=Anguilla anguilla TaxID=7936 RepID=A0A0E9VZW5_ANGAN
MSGELSKIKIWEPLMWLLESWLLI